MLSSRTLQSRLGPTVLALHVLSLILLFCLTAAADSPIDFNRDIRPILADNCFQCHGPDAATREADLRLDTQEGATSDSGGSAAILPGDADHSEVIRRIEDTEDPMPPTDSNRSLTEKQKSLLRDWVNAGANYDRHWSFVVPTRPDVPQVDVETKNPIDAFVAQRLKEQSLRFSPEATPETLIRRVTLDLTGIPPTVDEVNQFVREYSSGNQEAVWKALVDRLIGSPRYGETMALPWLDAARFADTDGYQYDGPRFQWRWRDWVIDAYNQNMPFDQFTIEQLAGDLIPNATMEQRIATAFNRNHRYNSEAGIVVEEFLLENAVDRVDTTSTLWMGLTMGCARCHDHKFDPISQKDYYQLIAFFNSVPESGRAIKSRNSEPVLSAPTSAQQLRLAELQAAVDLAEKKLAPGDTPQNGGLLIERNLGHHFALDQSLPEESKSNGTAEIRDGALHLDGESTVEIKGIKNTLAFKANQKFTLSAWIYADSLADSIILSRQSTGTTRPGLELSMLDDGRIQFDLITRWLAGVGRITTKEKLPLGEWTHLTITNDGSQSANGQQIFLNGKLAGVRVGYNTNSNVGGAKGDRPLTLGGGIRPGSNRFHGRIKDVRLFETTLWPEEIQVLGDVRGSEQRKHFSRVKMTPAYSKYEKARRTLENYEAQLPNVMVMEEAERPKETFVRQRGVYDSLGERVDRDVPSMFTSMDEGLPRNRLGFARWLVSKDHPLTARVAVNRYWQKYFGRGLVETPEDFGTQSQPPSHPRLLDWLAVEFMESGWDIARMQHLIVSSRTYRQSSKLDAERLQIDPQNRWLSHAPRLRLSGHAIRDQALFVSGLLSEQIGGPSVSPYQPANLWAEMSMGMKYKQSKGSDLFRRSLYTIWKRTVAPPTMAVFDAADREACWVGRKETNTPLQALALLNETAFVESARHLASRMLRKERDRIEFGFQSVTSRQPTPQERSVLEHALSQYRSAFEASPDNAKKLIEIGESPSVSDADPIELAAFTSLANVLLNLDEVITRE